MYSLGVNRPTEEEEIGMCSVHCLQRRLAATEEFCL